MENFSGDISNSVYRRTVAALKGQISVSGKMLELLMLLDGQTDVRTVSQKMNISMSDVRPFLSKLTEYGVIEEIQVDVPMLDQEIIGYMAGQLSRITGPIAQVMVEDAVMDISGGTSKVPKNQVADLIEVLGRQIPDENQRVEFIKNILQKLSDS